MYVGSAGFSPPPGGRVPPAGLFPPGAKKAPGLPLPGAGESRQGGKAGPRERAYVGDSSLTGAKRTAAGGENITVCKRRGQRRREADAGPFSETERSTTARGATTLALTVNDHDHPAGWRSLNEGQTSERCDLE